MIKPTHRPQTAQEITKGTLHLCQLIDNLVELSIANLEEVRAQLHEAIEARSLQPRHRYDQQSAMLRREENRANRRAIAAATRSIELLNSFKVQFTLNPNPPSHETKA